MKNIFANQTYDFCYTTLVRDKNVRASSYLFSSYNHYWYPTVYWDGGYRVDVGGGETAYNTSLDICEDRPVADLDLNLSFTWLGNATLDIRVSIQNNDTSEYRGWVQVYVTEITSTMGWNYESGGKPCTFAFLDWSIRDSVWLDPDSVWEDSAVWNGNEHNDGQGNDFGGITMDNVAVLAAVFNNEQHIGYSDPPTGKPFNAYYADEAALAWIDVPPYVPSDPSPEDDEMAVNPDVNLTWSGGDPQFFDRVTYDVYFGETDPPALVDSSHATTSYDPGTMALGTTYYWKIVARDSHDNSLVGPVWSFTVARRGDCNKDGEVLLSDAVQLINFVLWSGPPPDPYWCGDVNCDALVNLADIVYLVNYLLRSGPEPCQE